MISPLLEILKLESDEGFTEYSWKNSEMGSTFGSLEFSDDSEKNGEQLK